MNGLLNKITDIARTCGKVMLNARRDDSMINEKSGHANFWQQME